MPDATISWLLEPDNPAVRFLMLLLDLGYRDDRMHDAIELVRSQRAADGRFLLRDSMNGKLLVNVESLGKPSKWVTLHALRSLRAADA